MKARWPGRLCAGAVRAGPGGRGRSLVELVCGVWRGRVRGLCSTLQRAVEAGELIRGECAGGHVEACSALIPVDVGACHGMSLREIKDMLGASLGPCSVRR